MSRLDHVTIRVKPKQITAFYPLLTTGFRMTVRPGLSIQDLLCRQLDLDEDYVEKKIQTVFLDGKAVDDLERTVITDGATLALSAAMPGLVGATFRRGGFYSIMRDQITYTAASASTGPKKAGQITIKFFNLIAREIGPKVLCRGIEVNGKEFKDLFSNKAGRPCEDIAEEVLFNRRRVTCQEIGTFDLEDHTILLKVCLPA